MLVFSISAAEAVLQARLKRVCHQSGLHPGDISPLQKILKCCENGIDTL